MTTSKYRHIVKAIAEVPWAIRPSKLAVILDLVRFRAEGGDLTKEEIQARIGAGPAQRQAQTGGGVAVLPLWGVIAPKVDMFTEMSGGTALSSWRQSFHQALADPEVGAILIDIDSPGGQVDQVPEVAAEIRAARGTKPMVAIANTCAASAAYWLGSQADELVVTPSGEVGSIGVFSAHEDISELEKMEGVKTTLISAGKYKTEGNPFEPLDDEARAEYQRTVDEFYAMFIEAVAEGRGVGGSVVLDSYGQGRMLTAKRALKAGMVDRIETFDQALRRTMSLALLPATGSQSRRLGATARVVPNETDGPEHGPYADQGRAVLADLSAFVQRTRERKAARASANRPLGAGARQLVVEIRTELAAADDALEALLAEVHSADDRANALAAWATFEEQEARLNGVPVSV